jgi:glycine/D-amino acid oxidase-like deaminating enzyme/nitrite reductase/ring-hydroxylating ferredoxin subunit
MSESMFESYWMHSTESTSYPALTGDVDVDVAVVGGGIAGICTAWELTRSGRSVVVVEADRIVAGTTGYTTAKVTAQHTMIYAHLRAALGAQTSRLYAQSQLDAVQHLADVVAELGIDCDLERAPAYTYVTSPDQVQQIRDEVDAAQQAGLSASGVTETGLPFRIAAAIRVDDQAQFHPRKYLLALAEDLTRRGGQIFERTRVVDLDEGNPCRLTTENDATITARDVVVATHYPIFDRALLFSRLTPNREVVVAAPIDASQDPAGMYITQEENSRSVRTGPYRDGQRLLIVTGEHFKPGTPGVEDRFTTLAQWMRKHFNTNTIAYRWSAQDNSTPDKVPFIGRLHPGAEHTFVATGFRGWGMSNGIVASRLLTAHLTGEELPWAHIYDPRRIHPTVEAGAFLKANAAVARHFVRDRIRPPSHADSVDDIKPGMGAIVRHRGERHAVYRDENNGLHSVSATCTHLGCTVLFNDAERTWDCPCHGSRFSADGTVIHGPATSPLEPRPPTSNT